MTTIALLLSLLALSAAAQQQQQVQPNQGCSFQSTRSGYSLYWVVDAASQNIFFNLSYPNFPQNSYTGVGFGDSMNAGLDIILVALPANSNSPPQVIDANVKGYMSPVRDTNSEVQTRSVAYDGGNLNAQFIRPLVSSNGVGKTLTACTTWNFISSPGAAFANGTYAKHSAPPEQQQQCNVAQRCAGTIPAQFISTPNNGAWSSSSSSANNNNNNQMMMMNNQNQMNGQNFYSPYPPMQPQQQQQYGGYQQQPQPMPYGSQQQAQQPMPYGGQQPQQYQPNGQYSSNQIGGGAGMMNGQQQQPYYSPYGSQNSAPSYNTQQQQQQPQYGRRKRQAGSNIYGYNTNSNSGSSGPLIVQNPNYQFLPNSLADEYAQTYAQAAAQYDAQRGGVGGGFAGAQRDASSSFGPTTPRPVLSNQQQNQQNYQNIQRDTASGAYATIAPATNIYGYQYDTPSSSGLLNTPRTPTSSSSAAGRQFDPASSSIATNSVSARDQSLQRFYNPSVTSSVGNVYTGSLYNGGQGVPFSGLASPSSGASGNQRFFNPPSTVGTTTNTAATNNNGRLFDASGNPTNGVLLSGANRGPQPGQQVYYDPATLGATFGRKKRSTALLEAVRAKRQVRFFDPGNNQSAMYYPYRTETDFNLNAGQAGFSQVGGSGVNNVQYSAPVNNAVNGGVNGQRYYDTSRGVYVDNVAQYDSRGGNQYLQTAPVNPQSANFVQTLQNNARALSDYVDVSCSKQDPYWCQSYVQQIMSAQNSFGSYTSGLCNTLVASLQYSDNRCCNAVRAAGCQS